MKETLKNNKTTLTLLLGAIAALYAGTYMTYYKTGLKATYFKGKAFKTPLLSTIDKSIAFDTGGSFHNGLPHNHFSVLWEGFLQIKTSGKYTFISHNDDGFKLRIDKNVLINDWHAHAVNENRVTLSLEKGLHPIEVRYFDHIGNAVAKLSWITPYYTHEKPIPTQSFSYEE